MTIKEIGSTTRVQLGLVATVVTFIAGVLIWGIRLEAKVDRQGDKIHELQIISRSLSSIDRRLSRIEGRLGVKDEEGE